MDNTAMTNKRLFVIAVFYLDNFPVSAVNSSSLCLNLIWRMCDYMEKERGQLEITEKERKLNRVRAF